MPASPCFPPSGEYAAGPSLSTAESSLKVPLFMRWRPDWRHLRVIYAHDLWHPLASVVADRHGILGLRRRLERDLRAQHAGEPHGDARRAFLFRVAGADRKSVV